MNLEPALKRGLCAPTANAIADCPSGYALSYEDGSLLKPK